MKVRSGFWPLSGLQGVPPKGLLKGYAPLRYAPGKGLLKEGIPCLSRPSPGRALLEQAPHMAYLTSGSK